MFYQHPQFDYQSILVFFYLASIASLTGHVESLCGSSVCFRLFRVIV